MLSWSDGRSQFVLDFSLHGEKGKKEGKEQGLTAKQRQERFSRERTKDSPAAQRKEEYFVSKCDRLIAMVKAAILRKIPFDYLLVDSWFTNTALVDFVYRCHKQFHLLGMAKMGNTKYQSEWGDITAKALISKLNNNKKIRYSRALRCHYAITDVTLGQRKVRLIFCRRGKSNGWKLLLTTDISLDFKKAYRIYAMRWAIEVFFSDAKRHLGLADCSCRDFTSQVAHVSMVIVRYNLMGYIKRFHDYETIGALFSEIHLGVKELTVVEAIWETIIEVVAIVAELFSLDQEQLLSQILLDNRRLKAMRELAQTA
ncbi:MAG: transposase [Tannerellaceae bacterium]